MVLTRDGENWFKNPEYSLWITLTPYVPWQLDHASTLWVLGWINAVSAWITLTLWLLGDFNPHEHQIYFDPVNSGLTYLKNSGLTQPYEFLVDLLCTLDWLSLLNSVELTL